MEPRPDGVLRVLTALADPVRLEMVRRLLRANSAVPCASLYDGIDKSTASYHFKVLRNAGVTERVVLDGHANERLLLDSVDAVTPALVTAIFALDTGQPG